jgi:sugar (pentulose or hexulose) kinase
MEMGRIAEDGVPEDILLATEQMYRQSAEDLIAAMRALREGKTDEVKVAMQAVKDLRAAFQMVMDERTRVDKLRKQVAGVAGDCAFDFDAARDEIGRRLAQLRSAGGGG